MFFRGFSCLLTVVATFLADPDVLEPSVQNEVDHALEAMPKGLVPALGAEAVSFAALYATNGLSVTDRAISLVSSQKDGRWRWQGADVTPVAAWLLRRASCYPEPPETTNVASCMKKALELVHRRN